MQPLLTRDLSSFFRVPSSPFWFAVVGAGPAGATMALMLARKGFAVDVYEKRPDFRVAERLEAEVDK